MKKLMLIVFFIMLSQTSHADILLRFTDGSVNVWSSMREQGKEYCTYKSMVGEYCVLKSDVKFIQNVPNGSSAEEYMTAAGSEGVKGIAERQEDYSTRTQTMDNNIAAQHARSATIDRENAQKEREAKKQETYESFKRGTLK